MNTELAAIIAEELADHYNLSHDWRGECSCGHQFEGWPAIRAHQAERIAARLGIERFHGIVNDSPGLFRVRALEREEETSSPHAPDGALPPFPTLKNIEWTDDELIEIGRRVVEYAKTHPGVML